MYCIRYTSEVSLDFEYVGKLAELIIVCLESHSCHQWKIYITSKRWDTKFSFVVLFTYREAREFLSGCIFGVLVALWPPSQLLLEGPFWVFRKMFIKSIFLNCGEWVSKNIKLWDFQLRPFLSKLDPNKLLWSNYVKCLWSTRTRILIAFTEVIKKW